MTRIRSGAIPMFASEPPADRAPAAPASSPFRAALSAARKTERAPRRDDDERAAQDQSAERMAAAQPRTTTPSTASAEAPRHASAGAPEARTGAASAAQAIIDLPYVIAHSALTGPIGVPGKLGVKPAGAQAAALAAATAEAARAAAASGTVAPSDATGAASAAPPQPGAQHDDSPVAALLAAAVGRALGSFSRAAAGGGHDATADPDVAPDAAPTVQVSTGLEPVASKITPLEQAVHDLIGQFTPRDRSDERDRPSAGSADLEPATFPVFGASHAAPTAPAAATRGAAAPAEPGRAAPLAPPEPPANPSHVHLVLDDGPERVVVTVAMRGSDVHVALRASDEATSAALARNAASLDHAMRARGLALGDLTTERDPRDHRPSHSGEPREPRPSDAEPFELEETP